MAVAYVELDQDNLGAWLDPLYSFASTLDLDARCNAAAVVENRLQLTYPSRAAIRHFVDSGHFVLVAEEGDICGYIICTTDGKYGDGGRVRWIGADGTEPEQIAIYTTLADAGATRYGWLWGRVTNYSLRTLLVTNLPDCEYGIEGEDTVLTYKKPT